MRGHLFSVVGFFLFVTGAAAQTSPNLSDFQAALDRANSAAANSDIGSNLPGYRGDAGDLQGRADDDLVRLQTDGAYARSWSPVAPAIARTNAYRAAHPIDENAAWVKGALGVVNNPEPTAGEASGATQVVCHIAGSTTERLRLYSCEGGNVIETTHNTCDAYRDIVALPAIRTCESDTYYDNYSTYSDIASYTAAHKCTLFAGPDGLDRTRGCGYLIDRIGAAQCAPPRQISGSQYLEYCKSPVTGVSDVNFLGNRSYTCGASAGDGACRRTSETCASWIDQTNGVCAQKAVTYSCDTASWQDHGLNEQACASYSGDPACTPEAETCAQRALDRPEVMAALGLAPDACLLTHRSYACDAVTRSGSDCDVPAECRLRSQTCIDPNEDGSHPCQTYDYVYDCPSNVPTGDAGAVCDASWVNGTAVIRAADDPENDLPQALSAINALQQASASYRDGGQLTIFGGKSLRCGKSVGGLTNCCKDSGLLLDVGLASCNAEEKDLAAQQRNKACHYVGTYCSNKSLLGCLMKKMTYCCYGSVLARIVEEAGHSQLGSSWGDPKSPSCSGFSVADFQRIDLTQVDFSDFYADRMAALAQNDPNSTVAAIAASIEALNTSRTSKP